MIRTSWPVDFNLVKKPERQQPHSYHHRLAEALELDPLTFLEHGCKTLYTSLQVLSRQEHIAGVA